MVALLVYAYAIGERSSRAIERRCREDVAFRVITANQVPDHATVARFRVRHQDALGELFGQVLGLCADAGLVSVGVVALDGSKVAASASDRAIRSYEQIASEILEEAGRIDAAEDDIHGPARGDELPERLANREGRRAWLREAKQRLDLERAERAQSVPRDRTERLSICQRRLVEDWQTERFANRDYEARYARGVIERGRQQMGSGPRPHTPPPRPDGKLNTTDPDARRMKQGRNFIPAYNAQAVTTEQQIVIAAEVITEGVDFEQLNPMIAAAEHELEAAGVEHGPGVVLADAGYWSNGHIDALRQRGIVPIVAPDTSRDKPRKTRLGGPYDFMRRVLATEHGGKLYSQRQWMVEPVFAQIKTNRRIDRFKRRGLAAARSEWRLITATHNLLKLHPPRPASRRGLTPPRRTPPRPPAQTRAAQAHRLYATASRESSSDPAARERMTRQITRTPISGWR
jgi:hypothetical protein